MPKLKKLSQILFIMGLVVSLGAVGYTYYLRQTSPPGFCPINPARPFMWVGVVVLLASLMIDFWLGWKKKRDKKLHID